MLNEFLIPAQSELEEHRDKPFRKVQILVVCDMLLTGFDAPILQALYLDKKLLNHSLLQTIARVNRPYNELKGHGLILDYYGIFDHLNEALNYRPDELGDVAFPFDTILEHFRKTFQEIWDLFPHDTVPRDGSHDAFITAMKILRDVDGAEKQFDGGYRNLRVLYEALQPDERLRDYLRPYTWLTKLYMLYRKKFYPDASKSVEATEEDAARTRELIRDHIDVDELETEFPTYVLDEHFLTKLKDKKPDAKALDIEAMLSAELRIRLDQDESFRSLSEKLQRLIDEKRAGTLAGIALIEELEKLTDAVRQAVDEVNRPIAQQLALKVQGPQPSHRRRAGCRCRSSHAGTGRQALFRGLVDHVHGRPGADTRFVDAGRNTVLGCRVAVGRCHGLHRHAGADAQAAALPAAATNGCRFECERRWQR